MVSAGRAVVIAVLVVVGLYFLFFHKAPLPFNHESIGLGEGEILSTTHIIHDVIGLILLAGAVVVWRKSRAVTMPTSQKTTVK